MTKISIITISYNCADELEKTIQSVIEQSSREYDFYIIDGGSTDETNRIINKYRDSITQWISENDDGIYDAMNKGVRISKGDWVIFMNAGDVFASEKTIEKFIGVANYNFDLIYGDSYLEYQNTNHEPRYRKSGSVDKLWKKSQFSHQSLFTKRELLLEHPFQYENFKIAADAEFFIWAHANKRKYLRLEFPISITKAGGISDTQRIKSRLEYTSVVKKYYSKKEVIINYYILLKVILINVMKFIFRI